MCSLSVPSRSPQMLYLSGLHIEGCWCNPEFIHLPHSNLHLDSELDVGPERHGHSRRAASGGALGYSQDPTWLLGTVDHKELGRRYVTRLWRF